MKIRCKLGVVNQQVRICIKIQFGKVLGFILEGSGKLLGTSWQPLDAQRALFFACVFASFAHLSQFDICFVIFGPKMVPRLDFGRVLGAFGEGLGSIF